MNKYISRYIILMSMMTIMLAAGAVIQGCSQTGEDAAPILGPSSVVAQEAEQIMDAAPPQQPGERMHEVVPNIPGELCEIKGMADLIFVSYEHFTTYEVFVNGESQGSLFPQANMLVTVPEGAVKWQLKEQTGEGIRTLHGRLFAKRCNSYTVRADLERRAGPELVLDPIE